MTLIEITPSQIYCSTDDRRELLDLIPWLVKNYEKLVSDGQKAVTIYDVRDMLPQPTRAKEPA